MDRFNALGRGMQIMLVAGVLLLIDTFLDWQSIDTAIGSFGRNAWHGFGGVLLGLLVIVLVAWLAARLAAIEIPLPLSASLISVALGAAIFVVALLKNLVDDYSSFWSYVGVILAALVAVGAWFQIQAAGGMETLRTEMQGFQPSAPATTPAPEAREPAAPPQPAAGPSDTAQPAPPPPPAAAPPMGEPAAPPEETPAEESPATSSGIEPSTESSEEQR